MKLGRRIYKTRAVWSIKLLAVISCITLLINLYFQTYNDPEYTKVTLQSFSEFWRFHLKYPYDLLSYIFFIFLPSVYYGFFRGTVFYENGIVINRGFPLYNEMVFFDKIASFEIIHSKLMVAIRLKKSGREIIFAVKDIDRVLAILDQNGISGDLKRTNKIKLSRHSMILIFFIAIGIAVAIGQTSLGLSRFLFR